MPCQNEAIPEYLHWNGRDIYQDEDFLPDQWLYRITKNGNPIEFPGGTITSLSCKWSFLIEDTDLLTIDNPPLGNSYNLAIIQELRDFELKREKNLGDNLGWHKLTCELAHVPKECDYSHCEINIRHQIFNNEQETELIESYTYTYHIWQRGHPLLNSDGSYYKTLRKDYRMELIKIFRLP